MLTKEVSMVQVNHAPKKTQCSSCGKFRRTKWNKIAPNLKVGMTRCTKCQTVSYHALGDKKLAQEAMKMAASLNPEKPISSSEFLRPKYLDD